jgi:RHS repeat-associated protein
MSQALTGTSSTNYSVNGLGQRLVKAGANVGSGGTNEFVYDQQGHTLGEYGSTGTNIDETVWLPNTPVAALYGGYGTPTPVAVLTGSTGTTVSSLSADWLGAPHIIQNSSKVSEWTWDHAAFGDGIPNNNPNSLGAFTYNLGFPGQHYDSETATYYNYFRDAYNQQTGRYFQADPLGLSGGQASVYPYVFDDPLLYFDPYGLKWMFEWWEWEEVYKYMGLHHYINTWAVCSNSNDQYQIYQWVPGPYLALLQ